jgi:hypothetical protein
MCSHCPAGVDRNEAITHKGCQGCPLNCSQAAPADGYIGDETVIDLDEFAELHAAIA